MGKLLRKKIVFDSSKRRTAFLGTTAGLLAVLWLARQYGVSWVDSAYYIQITLMFIGSIILVSGMLFLMLLTYRFLKKTFRQ